MARAMWTGFLGFGLVNVPVGLYAATSDQTVHFNQLHAGTSNRVRYKKVDEATGVELDARDIVNGFPVGNGEYVVISREEMKDAAPGRSDVIEITDFVDLDRIDPMYFRQTYFLGPRGKGADRAYGLLRQAMHASKKVGIATLVLRDKEHLVAVRPGERVLVLETMYFADELRDPADQVDSLPAGVSPDARELAVARQLIDSLSTEWSPAHYRNTYRERIENLVEQKRAGHTVVVDSTAPRSNVVDLMAALQASVERTGKARPAPAAPHPDSDRGSDKRQSEQPPGPSKQQRFEGMSKAELLVRAARLEVHGRTKMTKLQLVRAVAEAEAPRARRRDAS